MNDEADKGREFFEKGTLYHKENKDSISIPDSITLFCNSNNCKKETTWIRIKPSPQDVSTRRLPSPPGNHRIPSKRVDLNPIHNNAYFCVYLCANCRDEDIIYFIDSDSESNYIQKIGQLPALEIEPPKEVKKNLNKNDLDLYKKALTCKNFSYGLGALTYIRRVVENSINKMLDIIKAYYAERDNGQEKVKEIEKVKKDTRFEPKIKCASEIIPEFLKSGGRNPFSIMHNKLSADIHRKSDEICLEDANEVIVAFEYVFENLSFYIERSKKYFDTLNKLNQ